MKEFKIKKLLAEKLGGGIFEYVPTDWEEVKDRYLIRYYHHTSYSLGQKRKKQEITISKEEFENL